MQPTTRKKKIMSMTRLTYRMNGSRITMKRRKYYRQPACYLCI